MSFTLAPLPYAHDALEPHIDTTTMQIHHGKHHQAYVDNLNKAVAGTEHESKTIEELVAAAGSISPAVRNNGGGHWNHTFFWESLAPNAGGAPTGALAEAIDDAFGSLDAFKVVMDDTNNTPDVIDRNQLVGQIYLQPTRTAEFILLDFNILPTGVEFGA